MNQQERKARAEAMNELKLSLIADLIVREGGYSDDPSDRGGKTRFGITEAVARENGYQGDMRELPYALAEQIYVARYWDALKLDEIAMHSDELAVQLFDFGVNSGTARAAKALQQLLNVLNNQGAHWPDLAVDGALGSKSLEALQAFIAKRKDEGMRVLTEAVRGLRLAFLVNLAVKDERQEKFQYGWLHRAVNLR